MRRNHQTGALALLLAASLLTSGCSGIRLPDTGSSGTSGAAAESTAAEKAKSMVHWVAETFGLNRAAESMESTSADSSAAAVTGSSDDTGSSGGSQNFYFSLLPEEMDERYQDNLPDGDSLFINNASFYYYYSVISDSQKAIYDGLLALVQHPDSTEYRKKIELDYDPSGDVFQVDFNYAYKALIADHPELFWFSQNGGLFQYYYSGNRQSNGKYAVMLQLEQTYDNAEAEMTAFNQAVSDFMSNIDLTQSQPMIALQIHDRLIDMVTYDDDLAATTEASGDVTDYGYTAYGALVANSRGEANTAVCDGYSYAFEYLCQQAGLEVTRITGKAGASTESMGGHSWNLIHYDDDQWYEVDATWDDQEPEISADDPHAALYQEAISDAAYWGKIRHYLFNVTTDTISSFNPGDEYTYYAPDGSYASFLGSSVHVRDNGSDPSTGDVLTCKAPVAYGTQYAYASLVG